MIENTETTQTKAAPPTKENAASQTLPPDNTATLKWQTTLSNLLVGPRHRFQAEIWGDHALHSTVSGLNRNYGLSFDREWREVPTRFGKPCRVKAYWVAADSRKRAFDLLGKLQKCEVVL
jgi:hypothetical protein